MIFAWNKQTRRRRRRDRRPRVVERLETRNLLTATPFGASEVDTGEYMLGNVYVTVVAFESDGSRDANLEDWNDAYRNQVKANIQDGLRWWEDTLDNAFPNHKHDLNFQIDFTFLDAPVATGYEPISRPSYDFEFWTSDFFSQVGFNTAGSFSENSRAFNHAQRELHDTDWAFTIFVVNDQNDDDGRFAVGGFDRAFAFAGGRFVISPAGRPASTFSHEIAHMFWARDEYPNGGSYTDSRGYYDTQNLNAWDNPAFLNGSQQRQPSIMDRGACNEGGGLLCDAFLAHTSSDSSLAMIGWVDSDGDGIFDVLDVPLTLEGVGSYDATSGTYTFAGYSSVQTLPNLNSSGPQNDISINHVSQAQYRIDGGAWLEARRYDDFTADLDLTIPLAVGQQIEIRTIDDTTGLTSPIFSGNTDQPTSTLVPGISGFVWDDVDGDGQWDADEVGLPGTMLQLVDQNGTPLQLGAGIEPDDYSSSTAINSVIPEVTLSGVGTGVSDDSVFSTSTNTASTGGKVFAAFSGACGICADWTSESRQLRMDFTAPVTSVSIDATAQILGDGGRLEIYDSSNNLLARSTTQQLASGASETMTLSRPTADISYAVARAQNNSTIHLDNLRFGPESTAVTDPRGRYQLPFLEPGTYTVQWVPTATGQSSSPATGKTTVSVVAGQAVGNVNFGVTTLVSPWQNPSNRFDVNSDGFVTPNDALLIINTLNAIGPRTLTNEPIPPYFDVNGDGSVTTNDVLRLINHINDRGSAEGEVGDVFASRGDVPAVPQPETEASWQVLIVPPAFHIATPNVVPPLALTVVPSNANPLSVNPVGHLGWRLTTDTNQAGAGTWASAPGSLPSVKSAARIAAHDQVMQRVAEEDGSLMPSSLDDALVQQLAADFRQA